MDSTLLAALVTACATVGAAVLTPLVQWALRSLPSAKRATEVRDRIYRTGFYCFALLLLLGCVVTLVLLRNSTGKYLGITPTLGRAVCLRLQSNASQYLERQASLTFPKTLDWLVPKTTELSQPDYYVSNTNLLGAVTSTTSRALSPATECLYMESHLRPASSFTGFMLCKCLGTFATDLSHMDEMLVVMNAEASDVVEFGLKDSNSNETKVKFPVIPGWHGYVIPMKSFGSVNMTRICILLFAHSCSVSTAANNRFWIARVEFR